MKHFSMIEWPTLVLFILCYGLWAVSLWFATTLPFISAIVLVLTIALQSSLQHEALHGHPTPWQRFNAVLAYPSLNLAIPYGRFRDTHLAHHQDQRLTDPYDDPESNYLDPDVWVNLPKPMQFVLRVNNTLAGRILLGPALAQGTFMVSDARSIIAGDRRIGSDWAWHVLCVVFILLGVHSMGISIWFYAACAYGGLCILKIRTFLEHRAHEAARARTVVIEDRGLLAFLFLNNNFHVVHHMHPQVAWYDLPALYAQKKDRFLACNEGYVYRSYGQIIRTYLWRAKDPVPHPIWSRSPLERDVDS